MKLVEIQPDKYPSMSRTLYTGVTCEIRGGGIVALLHNKNNSAGRQQVLEVRVLKGIGVVSFDFHRNLSAVQLTPVQAGDDLVMQMQNGIAGFEVWRPHIYLSQEEMADLEKISQVPNRYYV